MVFNGHNGHNGHNVRNVQSAHDGIVSCALAMLVAVAVLAGPATARAQEYPLRPLRLVVPYGPGGLGDLTGRLAGQRLALNLKQTVLVENRPGGDTMIGTRAALQAPPDGYTLLFATTTAGIAPLINADAAYRLDDLEVVTPLTFDGFALSINAALPAKNLAEFIAYIKANPGKVNYGVSGSMGPGELITSRFRAIAGLDMVKINYASGVPAQKDLAAGVIQAYIAGAVPNDVGGKIRVIATTGAERRSTAPDVPTFRESGFPGMVGGIWFAIAVNARTPALVKQRLSREGMSIVAAPDFRDKMASVGATAWPGTLQDFLAFIKADLALWDADIRRSAKTE